MKVVLVRPPFYALFGVVTPKMKTYPLNLLCLATYVRQRSGHEAAVVDGENLSAGLIEPGDGAGPDPELVMNEGIGRMVRVLEDPDHPLWSEIADSVLSLNPDLVGITCNSGNMDTVRMIAGQMKARGLPIILGGSHPTVLPEQSLKYTDSDMVAVGEGELTLVQVMNAMEEGGSLDTIRSLAWREDNRIRVNPRGALIESIDELPIPDRSLVDRSQYFGEVIMTGRGCPFNCAYCASRNIWGRHVRLRSVDSIIEELSQLRSEAQSPGPRPGRWVVKVVDDTFTVSRKRTLRLLEEILAEGLNCFEFTAGVRADTLDEDVVESLRKANFKRVTLGVESGSPRILKMIRKGEANEDVIKAVKLLRDAGIKSHAFFMIGLPDETTEDIELSKRLIAAARPDYVEINMVTPYPGTEIFEKLIFQDPMEIDRWYRWFHQGMATHSDRLGYDLDIEYENFLQFAREYNSATS